MGSLPRGRSNVQSTMLVSRFLLSLEAVDFGMEKVGTDYTFPLFPYRYVAEEIREKYGLKDLKLPNTLWHYTLKPKVFNHTSSPIANVHSNTTTGADTRALITKFTKIMTPEEKQRQWES